jgi:two-component system response regulator DesR
VIRTMIVDDQQDIRVLLRMMIEVAEGDVHVSCEAASGREAVAMIECCDPEVVVLDEMMPDMNGVETASAILARRPAQQMILCTAFLDADLEARARAAGFQAVLHKDRIDAVPALIRALVEPR